MNVLIALVAVAGAAALGVVARTRPGFARIGFAGAGLLALAAGLRDPLAEPLLTLVVAAAAVLVAIGVLDQAAAACVGARRSRLGRDAGSGRRRFIGTSLAVIGAAMVGGALGRTLLERGGVGGRRRSARFRIQRRPHRRRRAAPRSTSPD